MTVIRTARAAEGRFTQLANILLQDDRIDDRSRGIGCRILSFPPGMRHTSESLCKGARQGRDATRKALAELEEYGYLVRTRRQVEGGHWTTEWVVTDDPSALTVTEQSPAPKPENPSSVPPAEIDESPGGTEDGIPVVGGPGFKYLNTVDKHEEQTRNSTAPSSLARSSLTPQSRGAQRARPTQSGQADTESDDQVLAWELGPMTPDEQQVAYAMIANGSNVWAAVNTVKKLRREGWAA